MPARQHFEATGKPLFSSHMLDLSEEPLEENVEIVEALPRTDVGDRHDARDRARHHRRRGGRRRQLRQDESDLYTKPEEVAYVYEELRKVSDRFTIAAAFGNVHGVYKPGNVKLKPSILRDSQEYIQAKYGTGRGPVDFVFHGGSGSSPAEIAEAISYGVVKMNIDTDLQWAFWDGIREYEADKHGYLQGQIGNPEGADKPNKKAYDPRRGYGRARKRSSLASSRPSPS